MFNLGQLMGMGMNKQDVDEQVDTSETIEISALSLLKMLKHGKAGVPMEVMGLMLGEYVDEYTIKVIDVFAMPQNGTGVSVEAVDPVFQTKMLEMLQNTGRPENVVGWYHSHPGFGCWLSSVDIDTQVSFENLKARSVAVVVDPIQSVKGKVVIDAFRTINQQFLMLRKEPRQTTSNIGHLKKPTIQQLIRGLNKRYYSMPIGWRKNELEEKMLLNVHKRGWMDGLKMNKFDKHEKQNENTIKNIKKLTKKYNKMIQKENETKDLEKLEIENVGKLNPKKHLLQDSDNLMKSNINQTLSMMLNSIVF